MIISAPHLERAARYTALVSGLVLFAFAALELCGDAIGLLSLETMGDFAARQMTFVRSWPGLALLSVACLSHIGTTLWFTARRATWHVSLWDAAQIISGLLVPLLLLPYLVDTRLANMMFGVEDDTLYRLARLWPEHDFYYVILIVLLWGHGCLGLHQWLKLRSGYRAIAPVLAVAALAVPIAAIAGLVASARVVSVLMDEDTFAAQVRTATQWPTPEADATLWRWRLIATASYGALLLLTGGVFVTRVMNILVAPKIDVNYVNGPKFKAPAGPTLLEISCMNFVPHAATCGGRGRCTACSVRIEEGEASLPPQTAAEIEMLGADPRIRLACQIRPTAALTVTRLTSTSDTFTAEPEVDTAGLERQVAVLCVQLCDPSKLVSERRAYDAIFLMNEFLDLVYAAVSTQNGTVAGMTGRGIIAVFGRDAAEQVACQAATAAAAGIDVALARLNERFAAELGQPIAIAMGLAFGTAYLGRIGAGPSKPFGAIGPVIDAAYGLAEQAEERGLQLLSDLAQPQPDSFGPAGTDLMPLAKEGDTRVVLVKDDSQPAAPSEPEA